MNNRTRRIWYLALLLLVQGGAQADEAERMLGEGLAISPGVRKVLDENKVLPVSTGELTLSDGASDLPTDLPKAAQTLVERLTVTAPKALPSIAAKVQDATPVTIDIGLPAIAAGKVDSATDNKLATRVEDALDSKIPDAIPAVTPSETKNESPLFEKIETASDSDKSYSGPSNDALSRLEDALDSKIPDAIPPVTPSETKNESSLFEKIEAASYSDKSYSGPPNDALSRLEESRKGLSALRESASPATKLTLDKLDDILSPEFIDGLKRQVDDGLSLDDLNKKIDTLRVVQPLSAIDASSLSDTNTNTNTNTNADTDTDTDINTNTDSDTETDAQKLAEFNGLRALGDLASSHCKMASNSDDCEKNKSADATTNTDKLPDTSQTSSMYKPIDEGLKPVESKINTGLKKMNDTINESLSAVASKVKDGVAGAFTAMKDNNTQQSKDADADAKSKDYQKQADAVVVPRPKMENYKVTCKTDIGKCNRKRETAASRADRAAKQANKDTLQGQADNEDKSSRKFLAANDALVLKQNSIDESIDGAFASGQQTVNSSSTTVVVAAPTADQSDSDSTSSSDSTNPGSQSHTGRAGSLEVAGVSQVIILKNFLNASVGYKTKANQAIATIGMGDGIKKFGHTSGILVLSEVINAAVGANSLAMQVVASMGGIDGDQVVGDIVAARTLDNAINASVGSDTTADMRFFNIGGSIFRGGTLVQVGEGAINAAIGYQSTSTLHGGNIDGWISGSGNSVSGIKAPIAAAIGYKTDSTIRIDNVGPTALIYGNYDSLMVSVGSISAAIGYLSSSYVGAGNYDGKFHGSLTSTIATGPLMAAAVGAKTSAITRVGEVGGDVTIGGRAKIGIFAGTVGSFAIGAETQAISEVGVVDANVGGNLDIDITAGEILTGTVGVNTMAKTMIGSIKAPVLGNADITVHSGAINTFAIGLSDGKTIKSQTYIGNVLGQQSGNVKIDVVHAGVLSLGIGLVLDLGPFGTLDLSKDGCVSIGNVGGTGC
jgi:uncharacterized membrane protein